MTTIRSRAFRAGAAAAFGLLLAGCGDSSQEATLQETAPPADQTPARQSQPEMQPQQPASGAAAQQPAASGQSVGGAADAGAEGEVRIGSTDQMQFTVREFTVNAGEEVTLTLVHEGQLPVSAMGHNVVILQQGEDYMQFGTEVMQSGGSLDNNYVPESMRDRVVAFTDMIGGGETTTITFTAPEEPGEYPFLCSFPGHFGMMNGTMIVQ